MTQLRVLMAMLCLTLGITAYAEPHGSVDASIALDHQTENVLQAIVDGDWQSAATHANRLTKRFPDYALGQLLYS